MTTATMKRGFYTRPEWAQMSKPAIGARTVAGVEQLITQTGAVQNYEVGSRIEIGPSVYRYGLAGGVNLALGVLCQAPVPAALEHDLAPTVDHAAGVFVVTLTTGGAVLENAYAGGWLHVNDGTGQGQVLRILSHLATAGAAVCAFTCLDPLTTGLVAAADSLCALTANPYAAAIIHPAPPTAQLLGVPVVAIANAEYGWFQTRGPAAVLTDGTLHIFQQVRPGGVAGSVAHACQEVIMGATGAGAGTATGTFPDDSAGAANACRIVDATAGATFDLGSLATIIGKVMRVEATGDYSLIDLTLE